MSPGIVRIACGALATVLSATVMLTVALPAQASQPVAQSNGDVPALVGQHVDALPISVPLHGLRSATAQACTPNSILWNVNSGKVLEVYHSQTQNGALVDQWSYNGTNTQKWCSYFIGYHNGTPVYYYENSNSGKCLDLLNGNTSDGATVQQWNCSPYSNPNQQWAVTVPSNGVYILSPNTTQNIDQGYSYVLEVQGWSKSDGARVDIWTDDLGANQKWTCTLC